MHKRRPTQPIEFPAEFWIVVDMEEFAHGRVCRTRDDVNDAIMEIEALGGFPQIFRTGDGEIGRNVSEEFAEVEAAPFWSADDRADNAHQYAMEQF